MKQIGNLLRKIRIKSIRIHLESYEQSYLLLIVFSMMACKPDDLTINDLKRSHNSGRISDSSRRNSITMYI